MLNRNFFRRTLATAASVLIVAGLTCGQSVVRAADAHDLSAYQSTAEAILKQVQSGDIKGAKAAGAKWESKWDAAGLDEVYPAIDKQMDSVEAALKAGDTQRAITQLNKYLAMLAKVPKP